jgi:hypothetical protein
MKLGGERLRAQESVSKCLQVEMSGQPGREAWGPFIAPEEICLLGCQRPEHVRQTSLDPDRGNGKVWF